MNTNIMNPKAAAWDSVGGLFWKEGRQNAKPSDKMINKFLEGILAGQSCLIIGASTKSLIEEALSRNIKITVIDFSKKMCEDLAQEIGVKNVNILVHDALTHPPSLLKNNQQFIISDRLVNRFSQSETSIFFNNIKHYLCEHAELRTTIKMGLYEIDNALIEEGKSRGTVKNFYNEKEGWIDFSLAADELTTSVTPHGTISRDILINWYQKRAREARFNPLDIQQILLRNNFKIFNEELIDLTTNTYFYKAKI